MSKVSKYLSNPTDDAPPPTKRPTECLVNGCPLPGVYRQTNESSICCVHDEEPATRWAEQTTRIRRHEALWFAALDMTNAPAGTTFADSFKEKLVRAGAPEPKYREGDPMTVRRYGAQIRGWLIQKCKGEREKPPVDPARADTWKRLSEIA